MQVLNCLIIEDEPLAADIIRDYVEQLPGLALKGVCPDAISGMEKLRNEAIDLIFLDIHLPKLNGLDLIRSLNNNYHIILTTAYHQYALESYTLNVTDYLLKPIEFSRFVQAVNKVFTRVGQQPATEDPRQKHYFFNVDKTHVKLLADDILYVESLKDYVHIHTAVSKVITKFRIGEMEEVLNDPRFLRIHKSFIVNLDKVNAWTALTLELNGKKLPVGRTYRESVEKTLRETSNS